MRVAATADLIDDREYAAPPELVVTYLERRTPWDS
jgi:hypothetical protein